MSQSRESARIRGINRRWIWSWMDDVQVSADRPQEAGDYRDFRELEIGDSTSMCADGWERRRIDRWIFGCQNLLDRTPRGGISSSSETAYMQEETVLD